MDCQAQSGNNHGLDLGRLQRRILELATGFCRLMADGPVLEPCFVKLL
jgi:hypothetical protein